MIEWLRQNPRVTAVVAVAVALLIGCIVLFLQWQSAQDIQAERQKDRNNAADVYLRTSLNPDYDVAGLRAEEAALLGKPEFPTEFPVLGLSRYLATGEDVFSDVDIVEMGPSSKVTRPVGGKTYPAYETKVTVEGELTSIISFLEYVEEGPYTSIMVEDVEFKALEGGWQGKFTIVFITQ